MTEDTTRGSLQCKCDPETAFGEASAKKKPSAELALLASYYEAVEITGEGSAETIENLIGILEMKIEALLKPSSGDRIQQPC